MRLVCILMALLAYPQSLDYRLGWRIFHIISFNKEQLKLPTNFLEIEN